MLVYAVCSLQPEEGPQRIEALLAGDAPVERDPITPRGAAGPAGRADAAGEVRTLPCDLAASGGIDGFFIARLAPPRLTSGDLPMTLRPIRRALLSVHDKTGLVEFARALVEQGRRAASRPAAPPRALREAGIAGCRGQRGHRRARDPGRPGQDPASGRAWRDSGAARPAASTWRRWTSTACRRSTWSWSTSTRSRRPWRRAPISPPASSRSTSAARP